MIGLILRTEEFPRLVTILLDADRIGFDEKWVSVLRGEACVGLFSAESVLYAFEYPLPSEVTKFAKSIELALGVG